MLHSLKDGSWLYLGWRLQYYRIRRRNFHLITASLMSIKKLPFLFKLERPRIYSHNFFGVLYLSTVPFVILLLKNSYFLALSMFFWVKEKNLKKSCNLIGSEFSVILKTCSEQKNAGNHAFKWSKKLSLDRHDIEQNVCRKILQLKNVSSKIRAVYYFHTQDF